MKDFGGIVLTIFSAIIGLAIISVIISKKSSAPEIIQASSSALANVIAAAVNPIATASTNGNLGNSMFATGPVTDTSFLGNMYGVMGASSALGSSSGSGLQSWSSIASQIPNMKIAE